VVETTTKKIKSVRKEPPELQQVTTIMERPDMENIFKFYKVDENQENVIADFLESNSKVVPVLLEARLQIERLIGKFPLHLELEQDPEEKFEELFVIVKADKRPEESISLIEKLDREWFIPLHSDLMDRLNFDIETS
jgi:hypothetical protein